MYVHCIRCPRKMFFFLRNILFWDTLYIISFSIITLPFKISNEQQTICSVLKTRNIEFEKIDIAAPGMEPQRNFMRNNGKKRDGQRYPLPPQIFNGEQYRYYQKVTLGLSIKVFKFLYSLPQKTEHKHLKKLHKCKSLN